MTLAKLYNYTLFNGTLNYLTKIIDNSCKKKKTKPIIINCLNPHYFKSNINIF